MNVVITGASRGIGKAIALAFAKDGHKLFISATNQNLLTEVAGELLRAGAKEVQTYAADLAVTQQAVAFANWCNSLCTTDILINNAGVFLPGSLYTQPMDDIEKMMNINFYSTMHITRAILPKMIEHGSGHIFNMCSVAALKAYDGGGGYSISKFALNGYSTNLRHELKPWGIKVTTCYPGAVLTDSWSGFDNSTGRIMEATDIAQMVLAATKLSPQAVVEEIVIRPLLGDL